MSTHAPHPAAAPGAESSLVPREGWHCLHLFYSFDRAALKALLPAEREAGCVEVAKILDPNSQDAPARLQTSVVSGAKADFGLMMLDPDPLKLDGVRHRLAASGVGPALVPRYSYVSLTEVSEYVPTVERYGKRLIEEGEDATSATYAAKLKAYETREVMMRRQRLTPDFPEWPATCFYPMNKIRHPAANWFQLAFDERDRMMTEHGRSGMKFGGRVQQLITVSVGLDDWEWGVTLWARNPEFLKEIVYTMRFDEASARFAEFGPFYTSYVTTPDEMLRHCRVAAT